MVVSVANNTIKSRPGVGVIDAVLYEEALVLVWAVASTAGEIAMLGYRDATPFTSYRVPNKPDIQPAGAKRGGW